MMGAITVMNDTLTGVAELRIEGLGAAGDGIAHLDGQTVFIPGTLPGEDVRVRLAPSHPELIDIVHASPDRVIPLCDLFGECGGCALQHLSLPALLDWKTQRVTQALTAAGFTDLPLARMFQTTPKTRRRMDFAVQRVPGGVIIGLHRRNGDPVDMTECHVLHPEIFGLLTPLREVLGSLGALTGRGSLMVNLLDSGPDLTLQTPAPLTSADRIKLAAFAREHNLSRISWQDPKDLGIETVAQSGPVREDFDGVIVSPPPSAFLQATADAEKTIVAAVVDGLPSLNKKDVTVELFAGCGTLTFPMSEKGRVMAYEGNLAAAHCLKAASGGRRVDGFHRDLGRQPLLPHDLKSTRAVVLDPPYAGAGAQTAPLAKSAVPDIVYVSCNPAALEKDGRALWNAGFSVIGLTIVDQFLWSTEVEAVVVLSRDVKRIKRENSRRSRSDLSRSDS
ncbi:ribosomal large subunit 23S rRNA methyltransferase [Gluconobacter sphaericus NBRC 12467]|nr:ribosomal large subunit 23S rRNA methyltransferase [Gluconobacter sphaericus NBRC 12467]